MTGPTDRSMDNPLREPSSLSGRIHRYLTQGMTVVMLIGMAIALYAGQYLNSVLILVIIVSTYLPVMLGSRFDVYIPPELEMLACLFIFASWFLGDVAGFYHRFWWWDRALHFSSGVLLGLVGVLLLLVLNQHERTELQLRPRFTAFFAFLFAVALGAEWEIFEFVLDETFGMTMQRESLADTMWDLILDTGGALIVSALCYGYMKHGARSFVERWIFAAVEANRRRRGER